MTETDQSADAGLLYGVPAIAAFMGLRDRQVYHLAERGGLPTFKIGGKVCARRASVTAWLEGQDAAARALDDRNADA